MVLSLDMDMLEVYCMIPEETLKTMAEAGYNTMSVDKFSDLSHDSIERKMWKDIAKNMVYAIPYPTDLMKLHQVIVTSAGEKP